MKRISRNEQIINKKETDERIENVDTRAALIQALLSAPALPKIHKARDMRQPTPKSLLKSWGFRQTISRSKKATPIPPRTDWALMPAAVPQLLAPRKIRDKAQIR